MEQVSSVDSMTPSTDAKGKRAMGWWRMFRVFRGERRVRRDACLRLENISKSCSDRSEQTELDFIKLGGSLQSLYSAAKELTELTGSSVDALRQALTKSQLDGVDGLAAQSLRQLNTGLEETSELLARISRIVGTLRRLRGQAKNIQRIGGALKASVFGFAIESARTPQCQQAFGTFVEELRVLSLKVGEVGERLGREIHTADEFQTRGLNAMMANLGEMRKLAGQLEHSARAATQNSQRFLDASCQALTQAEAHTRQIASSADEAVYHLQFGDIIRQKLEHICQAVREAANLFAPDSPEEFSAQAAWVDGLLAIQVLQLEGIAKEIQAAHARLATAFQGIQGGADSLARALAALRETRKDRQPDPLAALRADAERMAGLGKQGRGLEARARDAAEQATRASAHLERHLSSVKAINDEIHLEALNAIIKTAALGDEGATLGVLSVQVDLLFRESNQVMTEIAENLRELVEAAPGETRGPEAASAGRSAADRQLGDGLEQITQACAAFTTASARALALARGQSESLAESGAALAMLTELMAALERQSQELSALRELLAPWKAPDTAPERLKRAPVTVNYTMRSEREIHAQATQGLAAARPEGAPAETEPTAAKTAPPAAPAPAADDNIEFF
jgi:hypothetical protein